MKTIHVHGHTIDVCGTCHGVWLDHEELRRINDEFEKGNTEHFEKWMSRDIRSDSPDHYHEETIKNCPKDHSLMKRFTFAGDSKVHLDTCPKCHGFWLDGDDVRRLIEYVRPNDLQELAATIIIRESYDFERIKKDARMFIGSNLLRLYMFSAYMNYKALHFFLILLSGLLRLFLEEQKRMSR